MSAAQKSDWAHPTPRPSSGTLEPARFERYRALLDEAYDAIAILSTTGEILHANRRWGDILDIDPATAIGMHVKDLVAPGFRVDAAFAQVASRPISQVVPLSHKSGRVVYVELSAKVVELDGAAQVLAIGRDVSQQLAQTRKLAKAEAMYRSLVERIPDIVWRMRADGGFSFVSPNVQAMLGVSRDALMRGGRALWTSHVHVDDLGRLDELFRGAVMSAAPYEHEFRFRTPDGRTLWLHSRVRVVREGNQTMIEGLTADVTERRLLEQGLAQAQKLEAIGRLTGGIAHDFNNLLAVILSNTSFILDALSPNDPRRGDAEEIQAAAERAAALTRQLLAFGRRQAIELVDVDVNDVIANVEKMLRRLAGDQVAIAIRTDPGVGPVCGSVGQLEQILVNLVVNARDALPRGGTIEIATAEIEVLPADPSHLPPGSYAMITVRDDGVGMDRETLARVFEPFFTTKPRGAGTGLGLATCHGIARQLGGNLTAFSEPGQGALFQLLLPRVRPSTTAWLPATADTRGHETVLLVEDNDGVRRGLARGLKLRGYRVVQAADYDEAVRAIGDLGAQLDLVVTDVMLPGRCGPDVIAAVRAAVPRAGAIAMSGHSDPEILDEILASGVELLHKPFSSDVLAAAIRTLRDRGDRDAPTMRRPEMPTARVAEPDLTDDST